MMLDIENRIMEEQRMKDQAEMKMVDLEQEEIEVMKRIRTTTQVHKNCNQLFDF